jgi:serine/threonine protein kinase
MGWSDLIGSRLDRYDVTAELGRGGSSRVYRAYDPDRKTDVAIKVIPNDAEDRQRFVRRFDLEVQVVRKLRHPNIIEILGSGKTDELVYLVMQCVTGGTLRQHFVRPLPIPRTISYINQMAAALHHAHEQGIIHRDVKPSNMLVDDTREGYVLLTDFGIAKIQGLRGLTKSGTTIGTPEYMAPEQAEGREIDRRADIYSLGCVLYEALAGRPPFVGATPVSVLYQQVHSRPSYIRGFNPDVPIELARIVDRSLEKDPRDRFSTAEQLANALRPFLNDSVNDSVRVSSNRMTEVPVSSPQVRTEQGFSPPAGPIALPDDGDLAELGSASLFPDDGFPLSADSDDLASIDDQETLPPPQPHALDGNAPSPGHPPARPTVPSQPYRPPTRPSGPVPPPFGPGSVPSLEELLAQVDPTTNPTGPSGAQDHPGARARPTYGSHPTIGGGPSAPWVGAEPARPRQEVAIAEASAPPNAVPVWDPATDEIPTLAMPAPQRRRRRSPLAGVGIVVLLALAVLGGWLGYTAYSASHATAQNNRPHPTPTATATPTPTPTATATPTPSPTATPTANPQAKLTSEARDTFRAVVLGAFADQACEPGNSVTHFSPGQAIYVNICTSSYIAPGPMSVFIRQNGAIVWTLRTGQYLSPGAGYFYYSRNYFAPGSYDVQVTILLDNQQIQAADQSFTIG